METLVIWAAQPREQAIANGLAPDVLAKHTKRAPGQGPAARLQQMQEYSTNTCYDKVVHFVGRCSSGKPLESVMNLGSWVCCAQIRGGLKLLSKVDIVSWDLGNDELLAKVLQG